MKEGLKKQFKCDDAGEVKECVGCKVEHHPELHSMKLTQPVLTQSLSDEFDVLLNDFHPVVESLGFEEAFEQAFGMSLEEFNDEFMDFIVTASESEKLAMLPRP